jgi:hypothetical protein
MAMVRPMSVCAEGAADNGMVVAATEDGAAAGGKDTVTTADDEAGVESREGDGEGCGGTDDEGGGNGSDGDDHNTKDGHGDNDDSYSNSPEYEEAPDARRHGPETGSSTSTSEEMGRQVRDFMMTSRSRRQYTDHGLWTTVADGGRENDSTRADAQDRTPQVRDSTHV